MRAIGKHLHVRCLHTTSRYEDSHRFTMFHAYVTYNGKSYKVIIDGASCVNISKSAVEKMYLKTEPHSQLYNATWIGKSFHSIIQRPVPIQFSSYSVCIWCDHMNATYILLGRFWLFYLNVKNLGKSNTYTFIFHRKRTVLTSSQSKSPFENQKNGLVTSTLCI